MATLPFTISARTAYPDIRAGSREAETSERVNPALNKGLERLNLTQSGSNCSSREFAPEPSQPSPARGQPATPAQSLLAALKAAWRRHRSRTILAELDDFMLKDIGLTRTEAQSESNKPFWQI